ncbi:MAG TPA: DUF1080 domain-containing protein [Bryobacteraceae bacterium]|nr:DUF1080 domain-containing protein [Bryobacteraceae bacterium]
MTTHFLRRVLPTAAVALTVALWTFQAQSARGAPKSVASGAWKKLFNGQNLDGWEVVNTGQWTVEDGAIVMRRQPNNWGGGWLVTRQDYGDFILRLKFKPGKDTFNTGILIRDPGHAEITRPALSGFEVKLAQGDRAENGNATIWYAASAYLQLLPADKWTSVEVRCIGDHITTFLDGRKMTETHSRRSYKGAIGLHLHGGRDLLEVRWKDIEIQELPEAPREYQLLEEKLVQAPGETTALLDTKTPLGGLDRSSAGTSVWTLQDGVLRGTGNHENGWLITKQSFTDFVLSFDFRVTSTGDGGLAFRIPQDGADAPAGSIFGTGYEFHVVDGDAVDPPSSITGVARAFMLNYNLERIYRPKQWNQGRIYVAGDHLVTYLNLEKEADVHTARSRGGRIAFRVGPQATVEFRNVDIKRVEEGTISAGL